MRIYLLGISAPHVRAVAACFKQVFSGALIEDASAGTAPLRTCPSLISTGTDTRAAAAGMGRVLALHRPAFLLASHPGEILVDAFVHGLCRSPALCDDGPANALIEEIGGRRAPLGALRDAWRIRLAGDPTRMAPLRMFALERLAHALDDCHVTVLRYEDFRRDWRAATGAAFPRHPKILQGMEQLHSPADTTRPDFLDWPLWADAWSDQIRSGDIRRYGQRFGYEMEAVAPETPTAGQREDLARHIVEAVNVFRDELALPRFAPGNNQVARGGALVAESSLQQLAGRNERALELAEQALAADPGLFAASVRVAGLVAARDPPRATELLGKAASFDGAASPPALIALAQAYAAAGAFERAIAAAEMLQGRGDGLPPHRVLAGILAAAGRPAEARSHAEAALRAAPQDRSAASLLTRLLAEGGDAPAAARILRGILEDGGGPEAAWRLTENPAALEADPGLAERAFDPAIARGV